MTPEEMERASAAPAWSRKRQRQLMLARRLAPTVVRGLGRTWRWDLPDGIPPGAFTQPPRPAIYVFWHRCLLPIAWFARDRGFGVLISQHFDGEVIAQVAEPLGYKLFRGSSTRGGKEALQEMNESLAAGQPLALTVDGPRGPRFRAKSGAIQLARATGAPIYGLHVSPQRAWEMKSWDRLQIPRPWAQLRGVWAGPLNVPADSGPGECEALRQEMETMLNRLREQHDSFTHRKDKG